VELRKRFLAVYTYIRFNTCLRQLDVEIDVSYKTVYRRVQRFIGALDAPQMCLEGPVEINELYVKPGLKGRERDRPPRSRGLSVDEARTSMTSHPCLFWLIATPATATCCQRKLQINR
jgi:hypothetical protein